MSKKFLAKLLIFCMVFTMLPMTAFGATAEDSATGATYTIDVDATATFTIGGTETSKDVSLPTNGTYATSQDVAITWVSVASTNADLVTATLNSGKVTIALKDGATVTEQTTVDITANATVKHEEDTVTTLNNIKLGTVTVNPAGTVETAYTITIADAANGTVTTDQTEGTALAGTTVKITATPATGYEVGTITVTATNGTAVEVTNNTFTMPASNVTITVTFNQTGTEVTEYEITVDPADNGTVTTDPAGKAAKGTEVTINATPAEGYGVDTITVKDANDKEVTVTDNKFTMPESDVTVTVTFKEVVTVNEVGVEVEPTMSGTTAIATVTEDAINKAIEDAVKAGTDMDNVVVGEVTINATSTDAVNAESAEVTLPTDAVKALTDKEVQKVKIETNVGTVSLPNEALTQGDTTKNLKLEVAKKQTSTATNVQTKGVFDVNLWRGDSKMSVSGLKAEIELEFTIEKGLAANLQLAYVDPTDGNKIKSIAWAKYDSVTGIIKGRINHLTEIVVVDPADIVDAWSIESAEAGAAGGAGKTLVVKLKGVYNGDQVVTFVATTGTGVDANTVATTQNVPTDTDTITYSYGANITKIFVYLTNTMPNLQDKDLGGAKVYDTRTK